MIFDKTLWQPNDRKKEELVPGGEEKVFILQIIYWGKYFVSLMCWWGLLVPQSMDLTGPDMDYNRIHFLRSKHWDLVLTRAKCWASRPSNGITLVDPNSQHSRAWDQFRLPLHRSRWMVTVPALARIFLDWPFSIINSLYSTRLIIYLTSSIFLVSFIDVKLLQAYWTLRNLQDWPSFALKLIMFGSNNSINFPEKRM